ncbi:MAG: iron-containing alcohol dehydrogenase, partial [Candidatus Sigynarchaeum springense]
FSPGAATTWLGRQADVTVVTSPRAIAAIEPSLKDRKTRVILDPPLEVAELDGIVPSITTPWIAGVGAGRVMDASKYLAMRARRKLCLIPSALSTTSWLNMAIALRKDGKIYFPGNKHANRTIIDPDFISKAPMALTLGGLVDILAACTAVTDWVIAHENAGDKLSARGIKEFTSLILKVLGSKATFLGAPSAVIRAVHDTFLEALALCGASFSGRPVEGSEHFLYYLAEETCKRRFVHGEIIALMMLAALQLQGPRAMVEPARMREFLAGIGVKFSPRELGMRREEMARVLKGARAFVTERKYPFSILNLVDFEHDLAKLDSILDWLFAL